MELAPPGPGEICVRVLAAGLCHSDLSVIDGSRPQPLPMVLGHEAAGEVVAGRPLLSHRLTLDDINAGFDRLRLGEAIRQVVVFAD